MAQIRSSRIASRLRLVDLASRVGLSVGRLSDVERGAGADTRLRTFVRLGKALERPFAANLTRAFGPERLVDAAHLAMQEWVLALARRFAWGAAGWEVPTRPLDPRRSIE